MLRFQKTRVHEDRDLNTSKRKELSSPSALLRYLSHSAQMRMSRGLVVRLDFRCGWLPRPVNLFEGRGSFLYFHKSGYLASLFFKNSC